MTTPESDPGIPREHFSSQYIDDIARVAVDENYFSPVWQDVLAITGRIHRLLDIGCGTGVFAQPAKKKTGCELHGVDGSSYALEQASLQGFSSLSLISDFNVDKLPFSEQQFDFCLCKDLLEHLLCPDKLLEEAYRVLCTDGWLLVHVPNHFTLQGRLRFLFSNDLDTYRYFPGAKRWDFPHIRFFTYESLLELIELKGFKLIKNLSHHFPAIPFGRFWAPIASAKKFMARTNPTQFAEGITLLVKKN